MSTPLVAAEDRPTNIIRVVFVGSAPAMGLTLVGPAQQGQRIGGIAPAPHRIPSRDASPSHSSRQSPLELFLQRDGVVALRISSAEDQGDAAAPGALGELLELL